MRKKKKSLEPKVTSLYGYIPMPKFVRPITISGIASTNLSGLVMPMPVIVVVT